MPHVPIGVTSQRLAIDATPRRDAGDEATQGCERGGRFRVRGDAAAEPTRNMGGAAIAACPDVRHQPTARNRRDPGADQEIRPYGAVDDADALDRRRRPPTGSSPGARWLRPSASSVTRGMCARRSSTGAGGSRVTRNETEHTPDNNIGRGDCHCVDVRAPATRPAIAVTASYSTSRAQRKPIRSNGSSVSSGITYALNAVTPV